MKGVGERGRRRKGRGGSESKITPPSIPAHAVVVYQGCLCPLFVMAHVVSPSRQLSPIEVCSSIRMCL